MTATIETVMVVDDHPINRRLAEVMLSREGWKTLSAASAEEALAMLDPQALRAVLVDLRLPGMDGYALCDEIRRRFPQERPRLVAYTAQIAPEKREELIKHGFDDALFKPISGADLRRALSVAAG
jgi:CheY-like chemotaxis protein